ncbi:N-acetyltransferase [Acinetobacter indicus]|uniref:GNAT family N-acetyltransferase n=1 Tax=Acinetobacter indicus TaxID=756892 RepID=UPI002574FC3F|nr:GNAT family N-acetyltransferase [Acinetobacter indicus]MDM1281663.1 N-acetyltransferase [Acinetobacter indicus]
MDIQHQEAKRGGAFFIELDGQRIAEITYQWQDTHKIVADHTWVDDSLRGQGIARQLLDVLVEFAREKQLKIVPVCSYVEVMFRREPSLADVAA